MGFASARLCGVQRQGVLLPMSASAQIVFSGRSTRPVTAAAAISSTARSESLLAERRVFSSAKAEAAS